MPRAQETSRTMETRRRHAKERRTAVEALTNEVLRLQLGDHANDNGFSIRLARAGA